MKDFRTLGLKGIRMRGGKISLSLLQSAGICQWLKQKSPVLANEGFSLCVVDLIIESLL
jgi:hypothetical protein